MLVNHQYNTAFFYRPWSIFLFRIGLAVDRILFVEAFRFGRTFLSKKNRHPDQKSHLKKFTLPIFESRLKKMTALKILSKVDIRRSIFRQFPVELLHSKMNLHGD